MSRLRDMLSAFRLGPTLAEVQQDMTPRQKAILARADKLLAEYRKADVQIVVIRK